MSQKKFNVDYQEIGKKVISIEREGLIQLEQYININFKIACEIILSCKGKIVLMGMGKSGHIGKRMAATLASTGTSSFFVHPAEASHGDLGMIDRNDVVIAISNSGESKEIIALIPILKRQKTVIICMTSHPKSSLGRAADVHLCIKVSQEACPFGFIPTTSSVAALVMGDAIAVAVLKSRGFTEENFALSHPGGTLGRKLLLKVKDIMHSGDAIPHVTRYASIKEALLEMTNKKLGIIAIVDHLMKIEGVFTDGDLHRIFDMNINFKTTCIQELMTLGEITITPNTLAGDALNLMQNKKIAALLVCDNSKLLGVIHMHDILATGII